MANTLSTSAATSHHRAETRSPAEWFCRIVGPVLILVGILGFFVDTDFGVGASAEGTHDTLLGFEVNGWHNVAHILTGLLPLAFLGSARRAKTGALVFAMGYLVVTILGFIGGNDVVQLLAINSADHVLHIALVVVALAAYALTRTDEVDRTAGPVR